VVQERVAVLGEVPSMVDFLFLDRPDIDEEAWAKAVTKDSDSAVDVLARAIEAYTDLSDGWDRDALHEATAALAERMGRSLSKAQAPIRVAVTGRRVGPPLFESLEVLGADRTLDRLRQALDRAGGS
jgi:glutamyl-tRNA synthetase